MARGISGHDKQRVLLYYALCLAILIHVGAIAWLRGLDLSSYTRAFSSERDEFVAEEEERQRKEEQLVALFKEIERPPPETTLNYSYQPIASDLDEAGFDPLNSQFSLDSLLLSEDADSLSDDSVDGVIVIPQTFGSVEQFYEELVSTINPIQIGATVGEGASGSTEGILLEGNKDSLRGFDPRTLGAIASSDDFNLSVEYAPRREAEGYNFRLQLSPKPGTKFKRIVQNIFFLVDRSHSIRFQRYEFTKRALRNVISMLHPGDTFNILLFDEAVERFSPENVPVNPVNIARARDFIARQRHGGVFATTELYTSLGKIVPEAVAENEVNTAILFSDGDTYLNSEKQRENIARWTQKNSGKVSLYSIASGKGNNLALLDLLSVFNKGTLHYISSDKGLEATVEKMLQGIRNPIGKEIVVTVVPLQPGPKIKTYPPVNLLPNLYENIPFVVYGTIDTLKDFHVFFQGKYYDKSLDIKQKVSFAQATTVDGAELERNLAVQRAYEAYGNYLVDGRAIHLLHAKQLLQPYNILSAFQ